MDATRGPASEPAAARQAALVFALAGLVTVLGIPASSVSTTAIVGVALAHALLAATAWWAPWRQGRLSSTAGLGVAGVLLLSLTTWALDGYGSGLGPLFVLLFAWLGLHQSYRVIVAAIPLAAGGYAGAMVAADAPARLVASTLVLIPICATVAVLIRRVVDRQRDTQHTLEVKDRWRGALMATLAHDVRSPLSSVMGTLEILEDDPDLDPRYRPLIEGAGRQTNRVLHLAMGILEVERVEQGKLRLDRRPVRLAELAQQVAVLTQVDQVEVDIDPTLTVLADPDRLEQILYNLTNNALRHGSPPIVIGASDGAAGPEIHVRDHGGGVAAEDVANLFDRFSSADHSPQSVGLGLWIVKLLAESHGGGVHYEPADPGARFVVSLPAGSVVEGATSRAELKSGGG